MATYYVSAQNGNDTNDGLSAANAWVTIGKAVGEVAAGDTVYIGAGTYREKLVFTTSGTLGNEIRWIPDPECQYLTIDNPGIVRVTGCGVDEIPTEGMVMDFIIITHNILGDPNKKYNQIYVDGADYGFDGYNSSPTTFYGVTSTAKIGSLYRIYHLNYCIGIGGWSAFHNCGELYHCVGIGRDRDYNLCNKLVNCLAIGGAQNANYFGGDCINCTAIGGDSGFYHTTGNRVKLLNCKAITCRYAARSGNVAQDALISGFFAFGCGVGTTSTDMDESSLTHVYQGVAGSGTEVKHISYDILPVINAFMPMVNNNYNNGNAGAVRCIAVQAGDTVTIKSTVFTAHADTTTVANREFAIGGTDWTDELSATALRICINDATYGVSGVTASGTGKTVHLDTEDFAAFTLTSSDNTRLTTLVAEITGYDLAGHSRELGSGRIDIGAYEYSLVETNFTEASPALEITRSGMQKFVFWAEGGTLFTKKVSVKWSNYAGANKPQIIVDGDHVTRATTTATGDGTAYEEISVSATPDADGEVELFLYARDTDADAKTYFKDLE